MKVHRERPYIEARRTYRNLLRRNMGAVLQEQAFRDADQAFDHGEWSAAREPEPEFHNAYGDVQTRLFLAAADAYGLDPTLLDDRMFWLDEDEADLAAPACPYHERGLDCRNSAPRGIDADGEPYGDRGCGCDKLALRGKKLRALTAGRAYAPRNMTGDPLALKSNGQRPVPPMFAHIDRRIVCHNTPTWSNESC